MKKYLGILIIILYFSNSFICELIYPIDNEQWFKLKYGILTICFYLALEYKPQNNFIEKLINAIILNNAYILIFETETNYSFNDIIFICTFTAIQYIKYFYNKLFKPQNND